MRYHRRRGARSFRGRRRVGRRGGLRRRVLRIGHRM